MKLGDKGWTDLKWTKTKQQTTNKKIHTIVKTTMKMNVGLGPCVVAIYLLACIYIPPLPCIVMHGLWQGEAA